MLPMPATIPFGDSLLLLIALLTLASISVFAFVDVVRRRDLSRSWKGLWIVVVFVPPFLGTLVYLLFRPAGATRADREAMQKADRGSPR
jgi:uncharacterized membrane protein YhaH (DUF805 family)